MKTAQEEAACRQRDGARLMTVQGIEQHLNTLGYTLDRTMDCRGPARYMTGPHAGESHLCLTTGVKQKDDGKSAFHFESRRDANFQALQQFRKEAFAIVGEYIFEL